jgi:hypothetical protein
MPTINSVQNPPPGSVLGQPPHLARNEDLLAFTDELGPLSPWRIGSGRIVATRSSPMEA